MQPQFSITPDKIKVVILCGGTGTRLREETEFRPKPLVEIGGRPMLWHIMKIYSHYGFKHFVLCLGYKGEMIKQYFLHYEMMNSDFTIRLGNTHQTEIHNCHVERDWVATLADTGRNAMTGARVRRIKPYIDGELFMLTYGDGVADINLHKLLQFHLAHGKIGTVTGTRPISRFGQLIVQGNKVVEFSEKPLLDQGVINGGFFIFHRKFFDYLSKDDDCVLERAPLESLARDGQLMVYLHEGFWHCMDTFRDLHHLNQIWESGAAPWKVWEQ